MSNGIVLSSAIRSNLLTLQNTAELQGRVQERLATGKKVNSALDNPTNFFTAAGLNRRGNDLGALLDGMSNGIQTLKAADNGMTSITKTVETMRAYVQQARQDKSFKGLSYAMTASATGNLTFAGGAVGTTPVTVAIPAATGVTAATLTGTQAVPGTYTGGSFTIQAPGLNGGTAVSVTVPANETAANVVIAINAALDGAAGGDGGVTASQTGGVLTLTGANGNNITVGGAASVLTAFGFTAGQASANGVVGQPAIDALVTSINTNASLTERIRASNDGGKLRIENLSTESLSVVGASATAVTGGTGAGSTSAVGGNDIRKNLITQFNELRRQLDKVAGDSSYNGVNLLKADKLKVVFNEIGTSVLEIQAKDVNGVVRGISTDANSLNIGIATAAEFSDDALLDVRLQGLSDALTVVQTQASSFGANLATVQIRQEFTKSMINTLNSGADNLVLADNNEEGANLLALNTRQQLSQTALSLASQASQAVLRLFG